MLQVGRATKGRILSSITECKISQIQQFQQNRVWTFTLSLRLAWRVKVGVDVKQGEECDLVCLFANNRLSIENRNTSSPR